ncbi:MAG: hypothetical protein LLG05_18740 [Porphyromonadaceae bacterium]|nr:hypothetical protein [Porphyromonadaceae bacterium]
MDLFLRLLDEATKKGIDLPTTKNADYRDKFNYFLDYACKYIAGIIKIPDVFQVTQNPIPNLLGLLKGYDMKQHLPGKDEVITLTGVKSYYMELDNVGTVTIAINGVTAKTITNTIKGTFTAHRGNTGATSTDTVTITFGGEYVYNYRNTGFYGYAFPLDADVPPYNSYVEYSVPTDFMEFDTVIMRGDPRVYQNYIAYKWENNKKVILNANDKGSFDVHYFRYPATILPTADDATEIDAEDKAIELIVLEAGIKATAADNPSLSSWLRQLFIEQIQNVTNDSRISETTVQTIYSM